MCVLGGERAITQSQAIKDIHLYCYQVYKVT